MLLSVQIVCCLLGLTLTSAFTDEENRPPRIGIVGAGIGGTSTAYFMRELFGPEAEIDIFEKGDVGGRLATVTVEGNEYEAGGSIIHPDNLHMDNFTRILGLEKLIDSDGILGIFNGEEMVLTTSSYSAITLAKMFWRYGLDVYRVKQWVKNDLLVKFKRIYEVHSAGYSYTNVPDLLSAMDPKFVKYMKKSIKKVLKDEGFGDLFIDELVLGAMRTNYGQNTDIPGFVGAVSLAGVGAGLWSIRGGNKKVPENLVTHTKSNLILADVKAVELLENEDYLYEVHYEPKGKKGEENSKQYDLVVIATPLHDGMSDISFEGFPSKIHNFPQKFHQTVATFVLGERNHTYFCKECSGSIPDDILTCNKDLFLSSLGMHTPVDTTQSSKQLAVVGKMFSNKVPDEEDLNRYYTSRKDTQVIPWLAYPEYDFKPDDLPTFLLHEKLYYVNAIELAASAMEMSAIAGRNVAILAYNHWHDTLDKIDETYPRNVEPGKGEL